MNALIKEDRYSALIQLEQCEISPLVNYLHVGMQQPALYATSALIPISISVCRHHFSGSASGAWIGGGQAFAFGLRRG